MANSSVAARLDPFGFFGWWFGELASLVPGFLRRGFRRGGRLLVLERQGAQLVARLRTGTRERELARIDLGQASEGERRRFGRRLARARRRQTEVVLRLPPEDVLMRHLDLPMVAEADLRAALYFEIDRQTPFPPEETYFDYTVVSRRSDEKRLGIDLTIVPRKVVANAESSLAEWQIEPDAVEVAVGPDAPPVRVELHEADEQGGGLGLGLLANLVMLLIVLAELALAVQIPLEARQRVADRLTAQVAQARARADATLASRHELDALIETSRSLQKRKLEAPSTVRIIEEVTRRLPDDTWLTNLQIDGTEIRLTGYAPTAATLIGLLDASEHFLTPSFRSPVTQDRRLGKERFSLSFELERTSAAQP